ncbi:MAG: glycosyltransferase family protein [Desulfobacterales bacterium]|nr:glycosyltransferase family protein [Desulfobacterales bacterium]
MKTVAIIQARMGSSRLPGKMLMDLCGYPILHWVLSRVKSAKEADRVVLATTTSPRDDALAELAAGLQVAVWRGSEADVLGRFIEAAREALADVVVRVCADNPLVAPEEIDRLIVFYRASLEQGVEPERLYAFNHIPALGNRYPDGLGAEIFSRALLEELAHQTESPYDREHVTVYLWKHPEDYDIRPVPAPCEIAYPQVKLDVDTQEDLQRLRWLCARLSPESSALDLVRAYLDKFCKT